MVNRRGRATVIEDFMSAPTRFDFDSRQARVVSDLARWMGLLGRFQIVGATFLFIMLLAVAALVTTAEVLEPAVGPTPEAPLVSIGEVSRTGIGIVVAGVVGFTLVFLRGGMLLVSAAEDLDTVIAKDKRDESSLETALRKLRSYFVIESVLMVAIAAATYAATLAGWPGTG